MGLKLFVDDWRNPPDDTWTLIRTISGAVNILVNQDVELLSLDHDIAHELAGQEDAIIKKYMACEEKYAVVATVVTLLPKERRPKKVILHTASPVGAANMKQILTGFVDEIEVKMSSPNRTI